MNAGAVLLRDDPSAMHHHEGRPVVAGRKHHSHGFGEQLFVDVVGQRLLREQIPHRPRGRARVGQGAGHGAEREEHVVRVGRQDHAPLVAEMTGAALGGASRRGDDAALLVNLEDEAAFLVVGHLVLGEEDALVERVAAVPLRHPDRRAEPLGRAVEGELGGGTDRPVTRAWYVGGSASGAKRQGHDCADGEDSFHGVLLADLGGLAAWPVRTNAPV